MKVFRTLIALVSLTVILLIQACGGGSGAGAITDTSGALTMTAPVVVDNGDGTSTVNTTVTYVPPAGKTAQGVVVTLNIAASNGTVLTDSFTYSSGVNSYTYGFIVTQSLTDSISVNFVANIGGMKTRTFCVVPKFIPPLVVSNQTVSFASTDVAGTSTTISISGGTAPYFVQSAQLADIAATLITPSSVQIRLINTPTGVPPVAATTTVTVSDSSPTPKTKVITVGYFK